MSAVDLSGRVAIVTGCGSALGAAIASGLAALGSSVVRYDRTADPRSAAAVVDEALRTFGRVDALVNTDLGACPETCLDAHLRGTMSFVEAVRGAMCAARYGRIVNFAGAAGLFGAHDAAAHAAAAAGVVGYSKSVSLALRDLGIRVNVLAPIVRHPLIEGAYPALDAERYDEACVAAATAYLCSDDCAVDGAVWTVGGGRIAQAFVATVPGHFDPCPSADDVGANLAEIVATDHAVIPRCAADELLLIEV